MQEKISTQKYDTTIINSKDSPITILSSNESTNFITSGISRGCKYSCLGCTIKTIYPKDINVSKSVDNLINAISKHVETLPWPKKPDHTHPKYYTYDIGYYCDIGIDFQYNREEHIKLFKFFRDNPKAMGVFSTKSVDYDLLNFLPDKKMRILMSIVPEFYRKLFDPQIEQSTKEKINAIDSFKCSEWESGILLSPVVIYSGYMNPFRALFEDIGFILMQENKNDYLVDIKFFKITKNQLENEHREMIRELINRPDIQMESKDEPGTLVYLNTVKKTAKDFLRDIVERVAGLNIRYIS
jgi:spore photoproduct lyase